jgi:quercetin dioxygenase-like cupin family protein
MKMKRTVVGSGAVALVLALTAWGIADAAKGGAAAVFVAAPDVKWSDVPGAPGIQMARLDGDPAKGPSHFLLKFAGGFSAPLHHHTADHSVTVVAGTLVLDVDGKAQKLPAGSFFTFSQMKRHATRCEAGADCVLSMDVRGAWDVVPEEGTASAKK